MKGKPKRFEFLAILEDARPEEAGLLWEAIR
jgi:hypothetical protein